MRGLYCLLCKKTERKKMKRIVLGILAHVDAGKTTLSESLLYLSGSIKKLGRVDHKNAFLDMNQLERARGITIFSKQAVFRWNEMDVTLLDTPGHADFSAEMERTLQVLDYAILVVSGIDGVQSHTETLWKLLERYSIPTFLFINKMDLGRAEVSLLMKEIKEKLSDSCLNFSVDQRSSNFYESIALIKESLLEDYLATNCVEQAAIKDLIYQREIFPCFFGSALKLEGVETFLDDLSKFTNPIVHSHEFGAKIYKITRDDQGNRLTHMKITGGSLKVKALLNNHSRGEHREDKFWEDKIEQIRIYSGIKYELVDEVMPGQVCAVVGLKESNKGEGLGMEMDSCFPSIEPVLNYKILLPPDVDPFLFYAKLKEMEEEDPQLHILWSDQGKEIHVQLMGEVQIEILQNLIQERFDIIVEFGLGHIIYKETLLEPVIGMGHFEPLRHYAEVHLLLEPDEIGSGLSFYTNCSLDNLDVNWQRMVLSHLEEKEHKGVLTGAPITDMRITLIAGKAHLKHTEGGDFRQATYRALRQGLKQGNTSLLEPFYDFYLEVPSEMIGRAMSDIQRMCGTFHSPELAGDMSILTGSAPVSTMRMYSKEVISYSRGRGRISLIFSGYRPCHNQGEVMIDIGYDSEADLENPTHSIFCSHGSGYRVEWNEVNSHMHLDSSSFFSKSMRVVPEAEQPRKDILGNNRIVSNNKVRNQSISMEEEQELEEIFTRTFGPIKGKQHLGSRMVGNEPKDTTESKRNPVNQKETKIVGTNRNNIHSSSQKEYLLVDGYNIIFAWEELCELAQDNLDAARYKLMDILCNYQGLKNCILILVFDAYKVKGGIGEIKNYHNIHVVYTKEAETADQFIEKTTHEIGKIHRVTVATSDALEQLIILGQGASRLSAYDLKVEVTRTMEEMKKEYLNKSYQGKVYLKEKLEEEIIHGILSDYE